MAQILLLRSNELTKYSPLGGNVDPDVYKPCVLDAQRTRLEELLGDTLYQKICDEFEADTLAGDYLTLYDNYIVPFLIHQSAVEYLRIGAYKINANGIFKTAPDNANAVETSDINGLVKNQSNKADMYANRMVQWLVLSGIPEYSNYEFIRPSKNWFIL